MARGRVRARRTTRSVEQEQRQGRGEGEAVTLHRGIAGQDDGHEGMERRDTNTTERIRVQTRRTLDSSSTFSLKIVTTSTYVC